MVPPVSPAIITAPIIPTATPPMVISTPVVLPAAMVIAGFCFAG
jgi:hypothetical protein